LQKNLKLYKKNPHMGQNKKIIKMAKIEMSENAIYKFVTKNKYNVKRILSKLKLLNVSVYICFLFKYFLYLIYC